MKVIIYALAAVLAVPSTLGQHHTRRLGVVNEQAAMSIDMITEALSMQSTAAVEPNEDPVYPVFGKSAKSGGHGGPTPTTSGKGGKSGPTAPSGSGKGGKSGPTAPSDGSSKSGKGTTSTTQATSPGTTGGTTSGTDATTPGTSSTVTTTSGTTSGTDPTTPDPTTPVTTDATTPGTTTPPDTTVVTPTPPPAGDCTIDDSTPFSDCSKTMSNNFCCTPTNTNNGDTICVNNISGENCGPGPAQLDMCAEPPGEDGTEGVTPCDPATQQCCKDANTNNEFCCIPEDFGSIFGLTCRDIPIAYCCLPVELRENGPTFFAIGLILQFFGLISDCNDNRRNLRSVADEKFMDNIMAKVASLLDEEEGGMEGIMAKVAELGVDADMMTQLVNVIGN